MIEAIYELFDLKVCRPNPIDWRDNATQNMIQTGILGGVFNGQHVLHIFNHTDHASLAPVTGANNTRLRIGYIITRLTEFNLGSQIVERFCERDRMLFFFADQVEYQS